MLEHNVQSLFLGTFAMGFVTIVNMLSVLSPRTVMLAWYLWILDVVVAVAIAVGVPFLMWVFLLFASGILRELTTLRFTRHQHEASTTTGLWLLPVVTLVVASATGGVVAEHLDPERARLTVQFWYDP
jgi:tellurite resistance protein TehA-like permease